MADTRIQAHDMHTDTHYTPYTNTNKTPHTNTQYTLLTNTHYTLHTNAHYILHTNTQYKYNILYISFATERQNNWTLSLKQCSYKENLALGEFHRD